MTTTRLCVGLDVPTGAEALELTSALSPHVDVFKVGLELFCSEGPGLVRDISSHGGEVFLDLKINDIPRQSAAAVEAAGGIGASYVTVHGNAGRPTLEAACEAAARARIEVLVVSVLTSLDDAALEEVGVHRSTGDQVAAIAELAAEVGARGLVLSTGELARIRPLWPAFLLVTPGIRPAGADAGDQRRVGTPAAATAAGSDMLVVARPIVGADDPVAAARAIGEEMRSARSEVRS